MEGSITDRKYGILPIKVLNFLISESSIKFFSKILIIIFFINKLVLTESRHEYWKFKFLTVLDKYKLGRMIKKLIT